MGEVGELCTIILTTSPTPSNPSTELIEETLRSMGAFAPELLGCRSIIVCDGYKSAAASKFRCGIVTEERAQAYETYMDALQKLVEEDPAPQWRRAELLRLPERHGFGFAVRAALPRVATPFVCIMQHDRTFMRPCDFVLRLLRAMGADDRLKMVGMPTTTNDPPRYLKAAESKLVEIKVPQPRPKLEDTILTSPESPGLRFIPMIMWHDSTHFASTAYYRDFVFGPRHMVSRGGFIEDKLGQQQGLDLRTIGWKSHAEYGTWLLDDGAPPPARLVGHLDGKHFLRADDKVAIQAQQRLLKAAAASAAASSSAPSALCPDAAAAAAAAPTGLVAAACGDTVGPPRSDDELSAALGRYRRPASGR